MSNEIQGSVIKLLKEQSGEGKFGRWQKQEFVIETKDQYPKKVCFAAWGDKVDVVKNLKPGEVITISFNPESREYNERWYTELKVWKIDKSSSGVPKDDVPPPFNENDIPPPEEEDLPF